MSNDPHKILARLNNGESLLIFINKSVLSILDIESLVSTVRDKKFHSVIVLTNGEASEFVKLVKEQMNASN